MIQNIYITGTNSGIGRITALTLAQKGHEVFATMRDIGGRNRDAAALLSREAQEAGGTIHVIEMALADDASVERAVHRVLEQAGHIDVIINNAGYGCIGLIETLTPDQLREQFDVNVVGPHRVMRAALPAMRARQKGLIIQVSSVGASFVIPGYGGYGASKAALDALSEAYRLELGQLGVEVTVVQAGAFPTDFMKNSAAGADQERAKGYGRLSNLLEDTSRSFERLKEIPHVPHPQAFANTIVDLIDSPAGSRPARLVVDPWVGTLTENLNKTRAELQTAFLAATGHSPPS